MLYAKKFKIIIVKMSYNITYNFIIVISIHCDSNSLYYTVLATEDDRRSTKTPYFKFKVVIHFLTIHLKSCKS